MRSIVGSPNCFCNRVLTLSKGRDTTVPHKAAQSIDLKFYTPKNNEFLQWTICYCVSETNPHFFV